MVAPWRRGSRPIDGGSSTTARARADHGWLQPRRPNGLPLQPNLMVAYTYSTSGSTSGNLSTTYTSSLGSRVSSDGAGGIDLASLLPRDLSSCRVNDDEEEAKWKLERAKGLVEEFCHGGDGDGGVGALERRLSEMGVGWVLGLADDASAGIRFLRDQPEVAKRWIRVLTEITESTLRAYPYPLCCSFSGLVEGRRLMMEEPAGAGTPDHLQLARFAEALVLKMIPFVDTLLAAVDLIINTSDNVARAPPAAEKLLQTLLDVREALSTASGAIQLWFLSASSVEAQQRSEEVVSLLSAKEHKLDEAIWSTMVEVRSRIVEPATDDDDDYNEGSTQTLQRSSNISEVTTSLITYIKSLWNNHRLLLSRIVRTAAELGDYVPDGDVISSFPLSESSEQHRTTDPFITLTLEMVSSLEGMLATRSRFIRDHSLRFLFLVNNTHFIWQQLHPLLGMECHMAVLTPKIQDYITKYLQVSWAPALSCLYDHTPHCFGVGADSALPKFDSRFQETYTAQKLWKVPDPELRRRLRKAIVRQVVPALTKYVEDNKITSPGVTPKEREKMLLELFEG